MTNDETSARHSEPFDCAQDWLRRGIPRQNLKLSSRDPSTLLRSAQDDGILILNSPFFIRPSSFVRHSSFELRHFS
jgi:hypothetical protein